MGIRSRDSCREHFRKLKILPLQSQYILSFSLFVIHDKNYFKLNFEVCCINSRAKSTLHVHSIIIACKLILTVIVKENTFLIAHTFQMCSILIHC